MNNHEAEFARKLTRALDRGAADLRPGTLYRLQQARAVAMAGVAATRAPRRELAMAAAGPGGVQGSRRRLAPAWWFGVALLVAAGGYGFQQWQAVQQVREFEDVDLHLLASDLPIDAYLDRGFQNWIRTAFDH